MKVFKWQFQVVNVAGEYFLNKELNIFVPIMIDTVYKKHLTDLENIATANTGIVYYSPITKKFGLLVSEHKINNTHPYIWGKGWYAIPDIDNENENLWFLSPIEYFDKHGHCPNGWEWEKPNVSDEEFEEFVDKHGYEPIIPEEFSYCMESAIECVEMLTKEQQKQILRDFGFTVDNVPEWYYNR